MANVSVTRDIDAPLAEVWESWDDYGNIDKFNPNLNRSFLIDDNGATGLGATRQCDLNDGKNHIQERIIGYEREKEIKIDIYNGTLPLRRAVATFSFEALGPAATRVTMHMEFTPKFGVLGQLMAPMLMAQMRKLLGKLLDGNKAYLEDGVVIARAA